MNNKKQKPVFVFVLFCFCFCFYFVFVFFAAGPVTFIDPVKFQGSMAVNGTVDGANLVFIYQDAVFKSKYKA